ncbi:MAG: hypothetical protein JKY61_09035 [Planctomycetes bacterium]|nr:hypothetical protein [Planctomycetota bacterium]
MQLSWGILISGYPCAAPSRPCGSLPGIGRIGLRRNWIGAANVQIEAGKVREVLVLAKERPKVEKVPLSGKVVVPEPVELKVLVWNETLGLVADIDHLPVGTKNACRVFVAVRASPRRDWGARISIEWQMDEGKTTKIEVQLVRERR